VVFERELDEFSGAALDLPHAPEVVERQVL
jgi:hypothetical protein